MSDPGSSVDRGLDRVPESDVLVDDAPVGKLHPQARRAGVGRRRDLDELAGDQSIDEPALVIDEVEAPILDDPKLGQVDLVGMLQPEAAHGRNRKPGDAGHRFDPTGRRRP